jgi:integrase
MVFEKSRPVTIKKNIQILKHLIRFLHAKGEIDDDFSEKIPYPRIYRKSDIPSVWSKEELKRIFDVIDTNSAIGKRNIVILLLASHLGLRGSDIRSLKLSDIDWENDTVNFIQSKTQLPVSLPLTAEVGEAIIEYLRYGRPKCNCEELILHHNPPFEPFESNTAFNNLIIRSANKAGIKFTPERKHGLHSLRHTFASDLLANDVPPSTIAGLLGHVSTDYVSVYLKTQDEMLRECSLDIEEVIARGR